MAHSLLLPSIYGKNPNYEFRKFNDDLAGGSREHNISAYRECTIHGNQKHNATTLSNNVTWIAQESEQSSGRSDIYCGQVRLFCTPLVVMASSSELSMAQVPGLVRTFFLLEPHEWKLEESVLMKCL